MSVSSPQMENIVNLASSTHRKEIINLIKNIKEIKG